MPTPEMERLVDALEELLDEASMPELVAALVWLSRRWKGRLEAEGGAESQGWAVWEQALSEALENGAGRSDLEVLTGPE